MEMYKLDYGWEIYVPDGWEMDREETGSYYFYPSDTEDETTLYASVFHSEYQNLLTPEEVMQQSFEKSMPENVQVTTYLINVHCKAFSTVTADGVFHYGAGYFCPGNLLTLNVFSKNEDEARKVAAGFDKVNFTGRRKNDI